MTRTSLFKLRDLLLEFVENSADLQENLDNGDILTNTDFNSALSLSNKLEKVIYGNDE